MATDKDFSQGGQFLEETRKLAKVKPKDAEQAITWSLMKIIGGNVKGVGFYAAELIFCEGIAMAAVAHFRADGKTALPAKG